MFKPQPQGHNRRNFFKSIFGEAASALEKNISNSPIGNMVSQAAAPEQKPKFCLSDLWLLSDDLMAQIRPVRFSHVETHTENEQVYAHFKNSGNKVFMFSNKPESMLVFGKFNSRFSIEEISKDLSLSMNWDENEAYVFVKNMFLSMVEKKICAPSNPVG